MEEIATPVEEQCPNCGGAVPVDSKFCKHCAFNLSEPAATPSVDSADDSSGYNKRLLLSGLAVVVLLLLLAVFIYRSRDSQSASAAFPAQTMGERAKQVEAQILNGVLLSNADLTGLSSYELRVLRNVHFARYGRNYDRPGMGDYFSTRSWYSPNASYNDNLLTATDKANVNLILAQQNQTKAAEAVATAATSEPTTPIESTSGGIFSGFFKPKNGLSNEQVQRAVDSSLDWTKKGGGVRVLGIQELPQESQAKADLQFDEFLYNATDLGTPVSKDKAPPPKPDPSSPSFYSDLMRFNNQQVRVTRYAGRGVAVLKHYNDGRWVLTNVQFGFITLNSNVVIQ